MTELDPSIVLKAYATPAPNFGAVMQQGEDYRRQKVLQGRQDTEYQQQQDALTKANTDAQATRGVVQQYGTDPTAARAAAFKTGNPELVAKLDQIRQSDAQNGEQNYQRAFQLSQRTAPMLLSLQKVPPQGMSSALDQLAPQLQQYGFQPEHIEQLKQQLGDPDPTKRQAAFASIQGSAQTYAEYQQQLDKAEQTRQFGVTSAETHRHNVVGEQDKPIKVGFGDAGFYDPNNGKFTGIPGNLGGGQGAGNAADTVYKNLPAPKPPSQMTLGEVQQFQKGTLLPQAGNSPMGAFQINYGTLQQYGPKVFGSNWQNTPFTPENQNALGEAIYNDRKGGELADTWSSLPRRGAGAYAKTPWLSVRDEIMQRETGRGQSASGAAPSAGAGGDDIHQAAVNGILMNNGNPPSTGRNQAMQQAIRHEITRIQQTGGLKDDDPAVQFSRNSIANTAGNKADTGGVAALAKQEAVVKASEYTATQNGNIVRSLAPAVGNGNMQIFNAWKNYYNTQSGDPKVAKFAAGIKTYADEVANVLARGAATDTQRAAVEAVINKQQSLPQLMGVMDTFDREMQNRSGSYDFERSAMLGRVTRKPGGQDQRKPSVSNW